MTTTEAFHHTAINYFPVYTCDNNGDLHSVNMKMFKAPVPPVLTQSGAPAEAQALAVDYNITLS